MPGWKVKIYNMALQGKGYRVDVATANGCFVYCAYVVASSIGHVYKHGLLFVYVT